MTTTTTRRTQTARTEATRAALIAAGRELFGAHGYAGTPTADIVEAAGVTRGALYHHFDGKEGLFEAVYDAVEAEATERIAAAALAEEDPYEGLLVGVDAFLDHCVLDPAVRRIALVEAPTVLGWDRWCELGDAYALGLTRVALQAAIDAGKLRPVPVDTLSHLLVGALREAGLVLSRSDDPDATRPVLRDLLAGLLAGYRVADD